MEIAIVAGEVSGDTHAAELVKAIKEISPNIKIWGIGGEKMKSNGVELIYDITQWALVGFWEVLKNYRKIRKVFYDMLNVIKKRKPSALILVDYPGFNLRLAKKVKSLSIPVIYYISPQVWAWGKGRIRQIKNYVDKMIVIFPFEKKFYEINKVPVEFVGHPMIDVLKNRVSKRIQLREELGVFHSGKLIGILPGSREQEIKRHLPVLLEAAKRLKGVKFVIGAASKSLSKLISSYNHPSSCTQGLDKSIPVLINRTYDIMEASDLILTSSGTATLETACFATPMVVIYKLNWLTYLFIKSMISIPNVAMVNVVAEECIVPELIQNQATPSVICKEALDILENGARKDRIINGLKRVRSKLEKTDAAKRAAKTICEFVHSRR